MLLQLWHTISVIIYAASAFLVICLLVVIAVYAVHEKYVQHMHFSYGLLFMAYIWFVGLTLGSGNKSGQVVHKDVSLPPSSTIWYW